MAKARMFSPATIKRFTSVHSWVGICTGMALFIAFFAGALTIYAGPIRQWANPELRRTSGSMADIEALVSRVSAMPAAKGSFSIAFDKNAAPVASFFEGGRGAGRAFRQHVLALDNSHQITERRSVSSVDHRINEIHYTIGLPKRTGYTLMGIVSAVYGLALVTGLLIHLPHLLGDLYALRVGKNLKKMWLDAHNAIGILSLPFHLMFAFTGLLICIMFLLGSGMEAMMPTDHAAQAYQQAQARHGGGHGGRFGTSGRHEREAGATMLLPYELIAIATGRVEGFQPSALSYSDYGTVKARSTVRGHVPGALLSESSVEVSPITGRIGKVDAPGERTSAYVMEGGYRALHYGDYGGEAMRVLYLLLGLGGAFLFYSGNLLWVETKRRRRSPEQSRSGWTMARITIGVCLGSCLGIGLMLGGALLLPPDLAGRGEWEGNLYDLGFFASVMWALARPPIRAATEILGACAATYLALPIVNAFTTGDGLPRAMADGLWDVALIDALLLSLGLGFALCARAASRRATGGQENSVWSLSSRSQARDSSLIRPQSSPPNFRLKQLPQSRKFDMCKIRQAESAHRAHSNGGTDTTGILIEEMK